MQEIRMVMWKHTKANNQQKKKNTLQIMNT